MHESRPYVRQRIGVSMSEKVIHEEHALRTGWLAIAGVCAVLAIAPDSELAFWARALILLLGASSLLVGLTRRSRSVWLDGRLRRTLGSPEFCFRHDRTAGGPIRHQCRRMTHGFGRNRRIR